MFQLEISSHAGAASFKGQEKVKALVTNCFSDPDWLHTFEAHSGLNMTPCHQLATINDSPVALLPAYIQGECLCGTIRDRLLGRYAEMPVYKRWGRQNALACASPWGFYSGIECRPEVEKDIYNALLKHVDEVARQKLLDISGFTFVPESASLLRISLQANGYKAIPNGPTTILDLKWGDFDEYVSELPSSKIRRVIRKERKLYKNLTSEWFEGNDLDTIFFGRPLHISLMALYNNIYRKYYGRPSMLGDSFLSELWRADRENLRLCIAMSDRKIIGFSLLRVFGPIAHALMMGRDYDEADDFSAYFNLLFYEPINRGIKEGWHSIHFRPGAYLAKLRRGCRLEKMYTYIKGHTFFTRTFLELYFPATRKYFLDKYSLPSLLE
jgi:predicted N-acyltransferase